MEPLSISSLYKLFLQCTTVTTDSRHCPEGSLFIALKGEKYNGNLFAEQALQNGADYAIVDEQTVQNPCIFRVTNTLDTLQQLANYHRTQAGIKVIGITGTNGKTTTKELMASVLSRKYKVLATEGNLNNHIGVPLTLLKLRPEHELALIEMGASHPGEIRKLAEIADPDFGIITNVGKGHLEGFGSFEGVIHTKRELFDYLRRKKAIVFVDLHNPYLNAMLEGLTPLYYGTVSDFEDTLPLTVSGRITGCSPFLSFEWKKKNNPTPYRVNTQLIGDYNLSNALAALAVGSHFGIDPDEINHAIQSYAPHNHRSQLMETGRNQLIIDAYNANPTSMQAALQNFIQLNVPRKAVILGDMKELGTASLEAHREIVRFIKNSGFERAVFVGSEFMAARESLLTQDASLAPEMEFYATTEEVKNGWGSQGVPEGYSILLKGSNSIGLTRLTDEL